MSLSIEDLKILRSPFPENSLGVKVQSLSRNKDKAMLVCYLQHTDVQDRLEQVDPAWSCETIRDDRVGDTVYVRMKMTVKGVTRENVGEGWDSKAAHSDCLKRCAMLFGVGRYLYDSETVWVPYSEERDKYRIFTYADYRSALRQGQPGVPLGENENTGGSKPKVAPRSTPENQHKKSQTLPPDEEKRQRTELTRTLMGLYRTFSGAYPDVQMSTLLKNRYGIEESSQLSIAEFKDLIEHMKSELEHAR